MEFLIQYISLATFTSLNQHNGRCATSRIFEFVGSIHDIESYRGLQSNLGTLQYIFITHWGHLSVILLWVSGALFHIGWTGNYTQWQLNPISTIAVSHPIWDPHFLGSSIEPYSNLSPTYSGLYHWLYTTGFRTDFQIYNFVLCIQLLSVAFLLIGKFHLSSIEDFVDQLSFVHASLSKTKQTHLILRLYALYMESSGTRLNFHVATLLGTFSTLWSGHIVHISIPASRGSSLFPPHSVNLLFNGNLVNYSLQPDSLGHIFTSPTGAGSALITFNGGFNGSYGSVPLSDIAHHHLAIGVFLIWVAHLYSSIFKAFGHRILDMVQVSGLRLMIKYATRSLHLQLFLSLLCISITTSTSAHQMYTTPPYAYLAYDYVATAALFIHHNWISSLLTTGAFAHSSLFIIRDYTSLALENQDPVTRILAHKAALVSHLSWVSLFLGFHTLGLYVHNDVVVSFGQCYKQVLLEPVIAHAATNVTYLTAKSFGYIGALLFSVLHTVDPSHAPIGPGDFIAYHATSLAFHVTSLILIKGTLDSRGSSLMPDKAQSNLGFACDGPSRGGTCDISSWDSSYLALFWALNSTSWTIFLFHWKHLLPWQSSTTKFEESSTFLNGWFKDYLWFNSACLIRGYDLYLVNNLSVWS